MSTSSLLPLLLAFGLSWAAALQAQTPAPKKSYKDRPASDKAAGTLKPYDYAPQAKYKGYTKQSMYLPMRDGVLIAIDIYKPKGLPKDEKVPTLIRQTRYWRAPQLRFPFNAFSKGLIGRTGKMMQKVIEQGYVIVNVDVRGSGASFGVQAHPWTADEVRDGHEIVTWITKQPWSNGKVGAIGVSYDGTAAEFLATTQHPALKAAIIMYALFDVYEDNAFPGGIHNSWFTYNWGLANALMDKNELPPNAQKYRHLIKGVAKVKGPGSKHVLNKAVMAHQYNRNVHDGAVTIDHRDDAPTDTFIKSVDEFSPHRYIEQLKQSGTAIYSYSGWHDGAYQHAAIKRHYNLEGPQHKLIIGPWEHGGKFNTSPWTHSEAGFDHLGEILKFFDYHLKDLDNGLYREPQVHYFTMGSEQWQGAEAWPPKGFETRTWFLQPAKALGKEVARQAGQDTIIVDNQSGTGDVSRWKSVNGKVEDPFVYADWTTRSAPWLHYLSEPFEQGAEFTGHAELQVYLASSSCDGGLFAYIEDVAPDGQVRQVTEGLLRLSHRKLSSEPLYRSPVPMRSHAWKDEQPLEPGERIQVDLQFLPVSYAFKPGHRLRLSLLGGDKDHFEAVIPQGHELYIFHGSAAPSKLMLPLRPLPKTLNK